MARRAQPHGCSQTDGSRPLAARQRRPSRARLLMRRRRGTSSCRRRQRLVRLQNLLKRVHLGAQLAGGQQLLLSARSSLPQHLAMGIFKIRRHDLHREDWRRWLVAAHDEVRVPWMNPSFPGHVRRLGWMGELVDLGGRQRPRRLGSCDVWIGAALQRVASAREHRAGAVLKFNLGRLHLPIRAASGHRGTLSDSLVAALFSLCSSARANRTGLPFSVKVS